MPLHAVYTTLDDLKSDDVLVINNYHGLVNENEYNNQKIVIYTCIGEATWDHELSDKLEKFKNSFIIVITTRNYPSTYEEKYNCKIFKIKSAYAQYSKWMTRVDIELNEKIFEKYFLSLNNRGTWSRLATCQFLIKFNLLDKFYFSYHHADRFNVGKENLYNQLIETVGSTWFNDGLDHKQIYSKLPIKGPLDDWEEEHEKIQIGNKDYYEKSFCSFFSEGYVDENYNVFFTEKIMRPLAYGHPFLVFSSAGALEELRSLGFETFGDIFDEVYDNIDNPQQRLEHIFRQIITICQLPTSELTNMYNQIKPKLQHNYNYFWNDWFKIYQKDMKIIKEQIKELIGKHI